MPQRAPGLPENSGIAAVSKDSVVGLSFRVQPWLCPFTAGDLGQVTQPSNEEKASLFLCLRGERTQRDDGNCKNSGNGNELAKYKDSNGVSAGLVGLGRKQPWGPAQGLPEPSPEPWKEMLGYLVCLPASAQKFGGSGLHCGCPSSFSPAPIPGSGPGVSCCSSLYSRLH